MHEYGMAWHGMAPANRTVLESQSFLGESGSLKTRTILLLLQGFVAPPRMRHGRQEEVSNTLKGPD
jgi:hypothetical protein